MLVAIVGGIQLMLMGVIGVYLGKIYEEVKQRPLSLGSEVDRPLIERYRPTKAVGGDLALSDYESVSFRAMTVYPSAIGSRESGTESDLWPYHFTYKRSACSTMLLSAAR